MPTKAIAAAPGKTVTTVELAGQELIDYNQREADWAATGADEALAEQERDWRNYELRSTDYTQLPDAPFDAAKVAEYVTYRQSLRDLPVQAGFPNTHTRPTKPV